MFFFSIFFPPINKFLFEFFENFYQLFSDDFCVTKIIVSKTGTGAPGWHASVLSYLEYLVKPFLKMLILYALVSFWNQFVLGSPIILWVVS
jgi:hypothetical protein